MIQRAVIKRLMRLKENIITYDPEKGAIFKELFDHPCFSGLDKSAQIEFALRWARQLYQYELETPSLEAYFGDMDLSRYFRDAVILDIGCYIGGKSIRLFEKYHSSEIHGIDIDPRFIEVATRFAEERRANAHFKVNYAEKLDYPDAFFDTIVTENTFEHVTDIQKVMGECNRVLKKRGFLVVIFPSFWTPFGHHLNLVTNTPCIHWFFKYPALLDAFFSILDERGDEALWYRRKDEHLLPYEKGYSINGTGAMRFHKYVKDNWDIIADGYKIRTRRKSLFKSTLVNGVKVFPFLRDLYYVAYVLQKRSTIARS